MNKDITSDQVSLIPKSEKDITEAWIQEVVGMTPIPNSISVEGNIQDGVGYLSYMCRVSFQTKDKGTQHIIVKMLPHSPDWKKIVVTDNVDLREIQFYEKIKPQLTEIDPSLHANMCTFYCGKYFERSNGNVKEEGDPASMLVMEDLRPLGYHMFNPESELWEENLTKVVKCLARLHCASLTLERTKKSKISEMFPFCFGVADEKTLFKNAKANVEKLYQFLTMKNESPEDRSVYREMSTGFERHFRATLKETMKTPCLIHGDLWSANIMVKEESDAPVKFIDWQLMGYRDPVAEVAPTILWCLPLKELRKETFDRFSRLYYDTCEALGDNLGRSRTEFQECFDTWGMAFAYLWFVSCIGPTVGTRMSLIFDALHKEYKLDEFLKNACK